MFILLMFILAYRYHRAGANGIGQTPFRNLVTIARSTGEHRANGQPPTFYRSACVARGRSELSAFGLCIARGHETSAIN